MRDTNDIVLLSKLDEEMEESELTDWLITKCSPEQVAKIINYIPSLREDDRIGYSKTTDEVFLKIGGRFFLIA